MNLKRLQKYLSLDWYKDYTIEEIEQELLIAAWKHKDTPDKGVSFAIRNLMFRNYLKNKKLNGYQQVDLDLDSLEDTFEPFCDLYTVLLDRDISVPIRDRFYLYLINELGLVKACASLNVVPMELQRILIKLK